MGYTALRTQPTDCRRLGGTRQVGAGDEQLMIGHHRLNVTDNLLPSLTGLSEGLPAPG
jgi:hypothetical protein